MSGAITLILGTHPLKSAPAPSLATTLEKASRIPVYCTLCIPGETVWIRVLITSKGVTMPLEAAPATLATARHFRKEPNLVSWSLWKNWVPIPTCRRRVR